VEFRRLGGQFERFRSLGRGIGGFRCRERGCRRVIVAGSFTFTGYPGTNKVRFAGRISDTNKLKTGQYILQITATNTQRKTALTAGDDCRCPPSPRA
jgi:hypothetical protein